MEVEIRVKVDSLDDVKSRLESKGFLFSEIIVQDDTYFKHKREIGAIQKPGCSILRVRETSTGSKLTFKALTEVVGSWDEHETVILEPSETKAMLLKSGFVNDLNIHKERQKGKLDGITVCLDKIEGLGTFIEMEIVSEDVLGGKERLLALAKELGFSDNDIVHKGYAAILFERQGVKYENTG